MTKKGNLNNKHSEKCDFMIKDSKVADPNSMDKTGR